MFRYVSGRKVRFCTGASVLTGIVLTLLLVASPAHAQLAPVHDAATEEVPASAPSTSSPPTEGQDPSSSETPAAAPASSEPAAEAQAPPPPPPPTPCATGRTERWACVDLTSGQAWLMNGDNVRYGPAKIRSGSGEIEPRTGQPKVTPLGRHRVQWKHMQHESGEYPNPQHPERGAYMPFAVFFADGGIAIHGSASLDNPSAGCVKLQMPYTPNGEPDYAAESAPRTFYEYLQVEPEGGDEVQVVQT